MHIIHSDKSVTRVAIYEDYNRLDTSSFMPLFSAGLVYDGEHMPQPRRLRVDWLEQE